MSVDVDRKVRVPLSDRSNQKGGGVRLEDTSHILDTQNIDVKLDQLVNQVNVVFEVVLLVGVQHVSRNAHSTLGNTTSLLNSLDTDLELVDIVQGIENTEDINTVLLGLLNKVFNSIVGERRVSNAVGTTEKHLERNVRNKLSHLAETVPGVLVEESHGDVKGSTTPALQTVEVGQGVAGLLGNAEKVNSSDTSGKQRLVSISPGGVHEQTTLVLANGLGEGLGALLEENVSPSLLARLADIDLLTIGVDDLRENNLTLELGLANLSLDRAAVDGDVSKIGQQLLGTVLATNEVKELRGIINKGSPAVAVDEGGVGEKRGKERDICLDASDTELDQGTEDLSTSNFIGRAVACALDQHGVVVRSNDSAGKAVATIQTNTVTTGRSVDLDLAGVRTELLSRVFCGDTALDGKATGGNAILGQSKLGKSGAGSNLDLSGNNINAGNFFSDGVLNLDTGVDFNEVVSVLLINQKLRSACIAVVDRFGQLDSISQNSITGLGGEVLGRSNFDDLLVSSLD